MNASQAPLRKSQLTVSFPKAGLAGQAVDVSIPTSPWIDHMVDQKGTYSQEGGYIV